MIEIMNIIKKPIPSAAYYLYWHFAYERQEVFFNRVNNKLILTEDEILGTYKFTNAYRASDRVSQYLIHNVLYSQNDYSNEDTMFRLLLFKIFNKIETWEYLEENIGEINWGSFDFHKYDRLLHESMDRGNKIYSNAYMMPRPSLSTYPKKHTNHLLLLEKMILDGITEKVLNAASLQEVFEILKTYPSIGNFLAFQYAIDINYSTLIDFSENDFVVAGPGALDGISKCFTNANEFSSEYIIKHMTDIQKKEFNRYDYQFQNLWGRDLHLIDCQNLFCEFSKYTRVAMPDIKGVANRTRIKQKYKYNNKSINYFYPPKWGVNSLVGVSNENI